MGNSAYHNQMGLLEQFALGLNDLFRLVCLNIKLRSTYV